MDNFSSYIHSLDDLIWSPAFKYCSHTGGSPTLYLSLEPQMPTPLRCIICTSNFKPKSTKQNCSPSFQAYSVLRLPFSVNGNSLLPMAQTSKLGIIFDSLLYHTPSINRSCQHYLQIMSRVWPLLTTCTATTLV